MFRYQTRIYLHGILAAFINGFTTVISTIIIDPTDFNLTTWPGFQKVLATALISGGVGAALYLRSHPLPDPVKDIDAVSASNKKIDEIKDKMDQ